MQMLALAALVPAAVPVAHGVGTHAATGQPRKSAPKPAPVPGG
jgi:hypothetical protein